MSAEPVAPDQRTFRRDVEGDRFRVGEADGRWRLMRVEWPMALMAVQAAARPDAPNEFVLRFDLTGYPGDAPTGAPWDLGAYQLLPEMQRPKGERVGRVFRTDWEEGRACSGGCVDVIRLA
jgi:hypothetical protein